jgi:putative DNA primase/helicase
MGLSFSDLYSADAKSAKTIVAEYDYRSLDGKLLYQAVRFSPKEFKQRRPDPAEKSGWAWNILPLKGKHVAYRLVDLKGHNFVVIVEGEKDADRLWKVGIPATTNVGGAKKWGSSETASLKAAGVTRVAIIPDNDEAGKQHADIVARSCKTAGIAVSVIELDVHVHGDVSDWLNNGGTPEALHALFNKPYVVPATAATTGDLPPAVTGPADALDVTKYHLTDLGAAESLRDRCGDRLRYDHQREIWLVWDGHYWRPDIDDAAFRLAQEHVRLMQRDSTSVPDFLERKKYIDFAMGREKRTSMQAMLSHASALKPLALSGDQWDMSGMLLGCPNGVVDLMTGEVRPGLHDDFVTLQTGVPYEHAESPRWIKYLDEVFNGDVELIDFVHRAIGYSLTADMREQCFFVLHGGGSNGKSIFIDALEHVFGTYGHRSDMRMFAGFGTESNAFQNADFRGKRMIFAAEVKAGARMNEHVLKHLTGGETLRAEHKYGRSFTIRPVGKIWLSVNHRPKVSDDSYGFWRRVRLIPFLRTFAGSADDRSLKSTLRDQAPGILQWAVSGCLEWQKRGLVPPQTVQDATNAYQQTEDPLADFFETRMKIDDSTVDAVATFPKLYSAYREWASSMGIADRDKLTAKAFTNIMETKPFQRLKVGNIYAYKGFEIISGYS